MRTFLFGLVLGLAGYGRIAGGQSIHERIYQIGGEVSAPELITRTTPAYSDELRSGRIRGAVMLVFVIDPSGSPRDIKISQGLSGEADKAATHAVNSWRFVPAQRSGGPVAVRATVALQFGPWLENQEWHIRVKTTAEAALRR